MIKQAKDLVNAAVKQIGLYQSGKETPIKTRFELFNRNALGGIFKGNIITIAGASGMGKSHFLQQIEEDIFNKELNPNCDNYVLLRVNWEMSVFKLLLRRLKSAIGKPIIDILFTEPDEDTLAKMSVECDKERNENIFYLEEALDPEEFYKVTREFLEEHKDKDHVIITVDHMALAKASSGNKKAAIDDTVEYINKLKREFNNASFLPLTQLNREIEGRTDVRFLNPRRSDIYASDTIFQISDMVVAVHSPFKLGHTKYMAFETADYEYLSKYMTKPGERKSNFMTKGLVFHHYMKMRELQEGRYAYDLHIEEMSSFRPSVDDEDEVDCRDDVEKEMNEQGFVKVESLEASPDFDEDDQPF
jgi:replicative DNA helicase